eukprot:scaffold86_cov338-Pavlova_lutheri.AAC.17
MGGGSIRTSYLIHPPSRPQKAMQGNSPPLVPSLGRPKPTPRKEGTQPPIYQRRKIDSHTWTEWRRRKNVDPHRSGMEKRKDGMDMAKLQNPNLSDNNSPSIRDPAT